ncbi:hypothetical protein [Limosilactobacillus reuteri]|nr:hypothetical protein [Limosilactobacillus reuteri]
MSFFSRRKLSEQEPNDHQYQLNKLNFKVTKLEDRIDKLKRFGV